MARALNKLSATAAKSVSKPGRHSDGGGLYLNVAPGGTKSWVFVFTRKAKKSEMGLGSYPDVSLADARAKAASFRVEVAAGRNPVKLRDRQIEPTFGECATEFITSMEKSWRNEKHRAQWSSTLKTYGKDIWNKQISQIETQDVLDLLKPIWHEKPETAARVRGRIERVIEYANASGKRSWAPNPAAWKGHLRAVLPAPAKLSRGHHPAMPYADVPAFFQALAGVDGMSARGLEFLVLTAARTGEVIGSTWAEFDLDVALWTVPADRMKAGKIHRVPLTARALEIVKALQDRRVNDFVFPGEKKDRPISNMAFTMLLRRMELGHFTPHGFRSSFRDWAGDKTLYPRELAEAALAHRLGDKTEEAYRRSDALEKRRKMMDAWSSYLIGKARKSPSSTGEQMRTEK
jgi:integrase